MRLPVAAIACLSIHILAFVVTIQIQMSSESSESFSQLVKRRQNFIKYGQTEQERECGESSQDSREGMVQQSGINAEEAIDLSQEEGSESNNELSSTEDYGRGGGGNSDSDSNHSAESNVQRIRMRGNTGGNGKFRLQGKMFAITYPKYAGSKEEFDEEFRRKFTGRKEYASAREEHKDGTHHMHVFIHFIKRKDVRSARYFDVSINSVKYHPNIKKVHNRKGWLDYISKGDEHNVASIEVDFDPLQFKLGKRKGAFMDWEWTKQFFENKKLQPIEYPIKLLCEGKEYEMVKPCPTIKKRNWWIVAKPNAGKTKWVNKTFAGKQIYCPRMGAYPFEGYANQDIIIYDDRTNVSFEEFSDVLNTWDIVKPIYGQIRYVTHNWKVGHTRNVIVLSNKTIEDSMKEEDWVRMKKRFIQIVNPVLIDETELSDDE